MFLITKGIFFLVQNLTSKAFFFLWEARSACRAKQIKTVQTSSSIWATWLCNIQFSLLFVFLSTFSVGIFCYPLEFLMVIFMPKIDNKAGQLYIIIFLFLYFKFSVLVWLIFCLILCILGSSLQSCDYNIFISQPRLQ